MNKLRTELAFSIICLLGISVLAPRLAVAALADAEMLVRNATEFRQAVAAAKPGTRILLAPSVYPGGFHFANLRGVTNEPSHMMSGGDVFWVSAKARCEARGQSPESAAFDGGKGDGGIE